MSFTGNEGAFISLSQAAVLTSNYRNGQQNPILGQFLGVQKLQDLLRQTDCVGLRIYYGKNAEGKPTIVVVGVDAHEDDILGEEPLILDQSTPCPPTCGHSNELNS